MDGEDIQGNHPSLKKKVELSRRTKGMGKDDWKLVLTVKGLDVNVICSQDKETSLNLIQLVGSK